MQLIGSGRDGEVFDLGDGRVLRRFRNGRSQEAEAKLITHLHELGYPVPEVYSASDSDMIMARIDGPTMLDDMAAHPWRAGAHARTLAELQSRLHRMQPPDWLPTVDRHESQSIIHLDFHPANVIVSSSGPVVIDWTNAAAGESWLDLCHTELLLRVAEVPGNLLVRSVATLLRRQFLGSYRRRYGQVDSPDSRMAQAAKRFLDDPNIRDGERRRAEAIIQNAYTK